jgi:two-component system LytT family response regulator
MSAQMITVIVADDEPVARRRLVRLLKAEAGMQVVAECAGGESTVEQIRARRPQLVFLDIQMPDLQGFQVIEKVGVANMPSIIFVTAYDQFALRAFEVHAVDYLLKPFDAERFRVAVARARGRLSSDRGGQYPGEDRLRAILNDLVRPPASAPTTHYPDRVAVKVDGTIRVMAIGDVDWFETDGNYIRIHVGRTSHLIRNTATRLQEELDPRRFARIHRRYLVNLDRVVEVQPWFGGDSVVIMRDGRKLKLSRNYRDEFHARMLSDHSESGERVVRDVG